MDTVDAMKAVVIEDNADLCDMLVEDLRSAGYNAIGFRTVEAFQEQKLTVDIFLLDINLPGATGLDFAREIRLNDRRVGIIVLSVRTGSEDRTEGYTCGVDVYLQKPCGSVELIAAINRVAERVLSYRSVKKPVSHQYQLVVSRLAFVGPLGEVILTPRETEFLIALAQNEPPQLTHDECKIYFTSGFTIKDGTLEVGVGRLRKKIEKVTGIKKSVINVRGVGYRLGLHLQIMQLEANLKKSQAV